ncbi:GDP-mannose 4,6-dehydratase [Haloarchaeobius litoreus]|uniref:GDP-mannose 4,6-dehydratase n=1 Tax=Haloarchaeobius litoreus TaxID=755306 RepID=A0ABD6DIH9_9EURY|nr:GDP-mannose 4,6-dehydratase [Haloarchaeobius litoreus]
MKILVTGGAGFIGGHLAEEFVLDGHDVVALDSLFDNYSLSIKEQNVAAAEAADGTYEFVEGDIRDEDIIERYVDWADMVYHQAARVGVRDSVEKPQSYNDVNVCGTLNVLEAARQTDIERLVVASSSSVYGKPEYLPYDEDHPTTPVSPYGVSKLASEQYVRMYNDVYDLPTVALRYFTVYGPRMRPNMAISNFVSRCFNGQPPVIYGDGTQTRDFTFVDDILTANRSLLETDAANGEVMNIGSTDNISIKALAEEVRDQLAPGVELEYDERFAADAEHTHASIEKANEIIGYEPTTTIREGVGEFIDWYEANRDWYEPLIR